MCDTMYETQSGQGTSLQLISELPSLTIWQTWNYRRKRRKGPLFFEVKEPIRKNMLSILSNVDKKLKKYIGTKDMILLFSVY